MPYTHKCAHTCVCVCVSVFVCVCIILSVIAAAVVRGEWWREGGVVTYPRVTCRRSRSVPIPINDIYLIPMNNIETIYIPVVTQSHSIFNSNKRYIPVVARSYHACNIHVDIQYIPTLQHPRFFFGGIHGTAIAICIAVSAVREIYIVYRNSQALWQSSRRRMATGCKASWQWSQGS
jgi:hypothetical protein